MTPIEQVTPALPGNAIRRPEPRNKRSSNEGAPERRQKDQRRQEQDRDRRPDGSGHIVDELA